MIAEYNQRNIFVIVRLSLPPKDSEHGHIISLVASMCEKCSSHKHSLISKEPGIFYQCENWTESSFSHFQVMKYYLAQNYNI